MDSRNIPEDARLRDIGLHGDRSYVVVDLTPKALIPIIFVILLTFGLGYIVGHYFGGRP